MSGLDVDEHRRRAAVADRVGGGDERVADGDDLVARPDADGQQRQVQRRRAVRDGAGVRRADELGELALERRDLRALRDPAGEDDAAGRFGLALVEHRLGDRDHLRVVWLMVMPAPSARSLLPPVDQRRAGLRRATTSASKPSMLAAPCRVGQAARDRVDLALGGRTPAASVEPMTLQQRCRRARSGWSRCRWRR